MRIILAGMLIVFLLSCSGSGGNEGSSKSVLKNIEKVAPNELPAEARYKGIFFDAVRWSDQNGTNVLVLSTELSSDWFSQTRHLYGIHYIRRGERFEMLWKMIDYEKNCYANLTCNFIPESTTITDLDEDGLAEVKLQYELACRQRESSAEMKILLYENGQKRALRGLRWVSSFKNLGSTYPYGIAEMCKCNTRARDKYGGQYESEKDFQDVPPAMLDYVRSEWKKYVVQEGGR
ncbi:MAG: hypothetical protein FJX92_02240 [Bacteroidetes bacterium]|nr:hypothetical protein [Bacteroidota bacterium]